MSESITDIIRNEFDKNDEVTLDELYNVLAKNPIVKHLESSKIKHRVRSTIYSLKKGNSIVQIGKATYKKA